MSQAIMMLAPAILAPWIAFVPTPPSPNTATDDPGVTFAARTAAPNPVATPQPIMNLNSGELSHYLW